MLLEILLFTCTLEVFVKHFLTQVKRDDKKEDDFNFDAIRRIGQN